MNKDDLKKSVLINLRCVTQSCKGGVPLNQLQNDYKELLGMTIPLNDLGYSSLESFLRDIPDVISLKNKNGCLIAEGVADASTTHIASLISKQKSTKKSKSNSAKPASKQSKSIKGTSCQNSTLPSTNVSSNIQNKNLGQDSKLSPEQQVFKKSVLINLRSVVQSSKNGVPLSRLQKDYKNFIGTFIPYQNLGYNSLEDFILDVPDVINLKKDVNGQLIAVGVIDSSTAHLFGDVGKQMPVKKPTVLPESIQQTSNSISSSETVSMPKISLSSTKIIPPTYNQQQIKTNKSAAQNLLQTSSFQVGQTISNLNHSNSSNTYNQIAEDRGTHDSPIIQAVTNSHKKFSDLFKPTIDNPNNQASDNLLVQPGIKTNPSLSINNDKDIGNVESSSVDCLHSNVAGHFGLGVSKTARRKRNKRAKLEKMKELEDQKSTLDIEKSSNNCDNLYHVNVSPAVNLQGNSSSMAKTVPSFHNQKQIQDTKSAAQYLQEVIPILQAVQATSSSNHSSTSNLENHNGKNISLLNSPVILKEKIDEKTSDASKNPVNMLVQSNNSAIPIDNKLMENLESSSMCNNIESNFTEDPVIVLSKSTRKKMNKLVRLEKLKETQESTLKIGESINTSDNLFGINNYIHQDVNNECKSNVNVNTPDITIEPRNFSAIIHLYFLLFGPPDMELLREKINSFAGFPFSKNSEQWKGKLNQLSMLSKRSLRRLLNLLFIPWDDVEDQNTLLFKLMGHFEAFTEEEGSYKQKNVPKVVNFCERSPVQKINAQHEGKTEKNQVQFSNGKEDLNLVPNASVTKKKKTKTKIVKNIEIVAQKQLPSFNRASSICSDASSEKCVGINTKQNIGVESSVMSSHSYPTLGGSVTKKKKTKRKRKKAANSEPIIVHEIIKTDKNAEQTITKSVKVIVPW
ncbi:uncharacterized protein CDAR_246761 [Caerostris darwini]|uniref:HTH OST-type domain-containing protein n=1 Tax=Caerostris darwini TaxID=1538125 RepID=A0AAV4T9V5_9ARAC|nr:uncharacterized protein CDAR_246761 [Caerostris darwini]